MISYTSAPPPSKHPVGCCGISIVFFGITVCIWLTLISGFGTDLLHNTPVISIPLPLSIAQAKPQDTTFQVIGKPSLSAAFINQVLTQAHSPAASTGQALYTLSVASGVDDAYALAFFQHESAFGTTGIAQVTRSLGNIRCSAGYSCLFGFRAYPTWQAGYADWYTLIRTLYVAHWHLLTLPQIVPVYAPASDGNDVAAYIAAVEQDVTEWRAGKGLS